MTEANDILQSSYIGDDTSIDIFNKLISSSSLSNSNISSFIVKRIDDIFNGITTVNNVYNSVLTYIAAEAILAVITQNSIQTGSDLQIPPRIPANFTTINTTENIICGGNVGIGIDNPNLKLEVNGNIKVNDAIVGSGTTLELFSNTSAVNSSSFIEMRQDTITVGGPNLEFYCNSNGSSVGTRAIKILSNGNVGIGIDNPNQKLEVNGNIRTTSLGHALEFTGVQNKPVYLRTHSRLHTEEPALELHGCRWFTLLGENGTDTNILQTSTVSWNTSAKKSDDRLKHNEEIITNGLDIIRKLVPQKYQKTTDVKDADFNGELEEGSWIWEAGIIAQDLEKIDELKYLVNVNETSQDKIKGVRYEDLFVYNISATKELDKIVEEKKIEINKLKEENVLMKEKLNLLISRIEVLEGH